MKIMIILQSKICMYMEIVKRSTFHPACGCCLAVVETWIVETYSDYDEVVIVIAKQSSDVKCKRNRAE